MKKIVQALLVAWALPQSPALSATHVEYVEECRSTTDDRAVTVHSIQQVHSPYVSAVEVRDGSFEVADTFVPSSPSGDPSRFCLYPYYANGLILRGANITLYDCRAVDVQGTWRGDHKVSVDFEENGALQSFAYHDPAQFRCATHCAKPNCQ